MKKEIKEEQLNSTKHIINTFLEKAIERRKNEYTEASDEAIIENIEGKVNEFVWILANRADELAELDKRMTWDVCLHNAMLEQENINGFNAHPDKVEEKHKTAILFIWIAYYYAQYFDFEVMPFSIEAIN